MGKFLNIGWTFNETMSLPSMFNETCLQTFGKCILGLLFSCSNYFKKPVYQLVFRVFIMDRIGRRSIQFFSFLEANALVITVNLVFSGTKVSYIKLHSFNSFNSFHIFILIYILYWWAISMNFDPLLSSFEFGWEVNEYILKLWFGLFFTTLCLQNAHFEHHILCYFFSLQVF